MELYEGKTLPPLEIQYKDFAHWQNSPAQRTELAKQEAYWLEKLGGDLPALNMFTDFPRPEAQSFDGATIRNRLDKELTRRVKQLAADNGVTLYMLLLAVYNVLLFKYTGQEDIVIGTPIAGRTRPEFQGIIGLFINVMVIRNFPNGETSFQHFLQAVKENTVTSFENQDYPFGELMEKKDVKNDISRNPLYDIELVVQNMDVPRFELEGLNFRYYPHEPGIAQVDIALYAMEYEDEMLMHFIYCTRLFKRETIQRFADFFGTLLETLVQNPDIQLKDINIAHDLAVVDDNAYQDADGDFDF